MGLTSAVRRSIAAAVLVALALLFGACSSVRYVTQAVAGGAAVLVKRRPIERVLQGGELDAEKERKLRAVSALRAFAERDLALPVGGAYASYAALGRDVVTWNVVATPELSLAPLTWCFPIAGCVSYRGYFRQAGARRFAASLAERGFDVIITEAIAYSTLGWFDDPVLDGFLALPDHQLAALLFHELAHRRVYAPDDTAFNEAYATAVEELGLERWLAATADQATIAAVRAELDEERRFDALRLAARAELDALYASPASEAAKREGKRRILAALAAEHRRLRETGALGPRWDPWLGRAWNNADLAAAAEYLRWLPALRGLFEQSGGFAAFHVAAEKLAASTAEARSERLSELDASAAR